MQLAGIFSDAQVLDSEPAQHSLNALHDTLADALVTLGPLLSSQQRNTAALTAHFEQALAQLRAREASAAELAASASTSAGVAQDAYASAQQAMEQLQARISELASTRSELAAARAANAAAEARLTTLRTELADRRTDLDSLRAEHARYQAEVATLLHPRIPSPDSETEAEPEPSAYVGRIDLRAENNSHTRVVRYIQETTGESPARILEVGCSEGLPWRGPARTRPRSVGHRNPPRRGGESARRAEHRVRGHRRNVSAAGRTRRCAVRFRAVRRTCSSTSLIRAGCCKPPPGASPNGAR